MRLSRSFKYAFNMVVHAKLRSWLTIVGIVIGVAAVVSIISLGEALQRNITFELGDLGGDILTVIPSASRANDFGPGDRDFSSQTATKPSVISRRDVQALRGVGDIKLMSAEISGSAEIYYLAEKGNVNVEGVDQTAWSRLTNAKIKEGRLLGASDSNVIVVGDYIATDFFKRQLGVNQLVTIENKLFRIVGILERGGSVYMPIKSAYEVLKDKEKDSYDSVVIRVNNEDELDAAIENVVNALMISRQVTNETLDFTVISNKQISESVSGAVNALTLFLTGIASIALVVGAVGIANTMFTSVLEKTKEIGIMKAVGARNGDILTIFLLNSGLIGLIGGVLGVVFGVLVSILLQLVINNAAGIESSSGTIISLRSVFVALGISFFIGVISGIIPAHQASKLKPVDALRYE